MIRHSMPTVGGEELSAMQSVLASGHLSQGARVTQFEHALAHYAGRAYAAAMSSGTAALYCALRALGAGVGDNVILPSFCCNAVLHAVLLTGASANIVDITPDDYAIAGDDVTHAINRKTRAVIVPHMFGSPVDLKRFEALPVPVIEDCAQAIGGKIGNRSIGSFGVVSIFSFYATKLITAGEGGAVVSNNHSIIKTVQDIRSCDGKINQTQRFNFKLTDLQAAIACVQLKKLDGFIKKRKSIALQYTRSFKSILGISLPMSVPAREHIFFRYVVRTPMPAERVISRFKKYGIEAKIPVPIPLHKIVRLNDQKFPHTMRAYRHAVSIPLYPSMNNAMIRQVITVTKGIFNS